MSSSILGPVICGSLTPDMAIGESCNAYLRACEIPPLIPAARQYFRPPPSIRPQVYRFEPNTGVVQAVADELRAPNGIELSPDLKHVYVTDSGSSTYSNHDNLTGPASIYRFDITPDGKRLQNRQLFAYADQGIPDGIHTDTAGNVYAGCGDGINV